MSREDWEKDFRGATVVTFSAVMWPEIDLCEEHCGASTAS